VRLVIVNKLGTQVTAKMDFKNYPGIANANEERSTLIRL
jgi:hypothetical protein